MFKLDIALFDFFYNIFKNFGACFTLGAWEGFVMLAGCFTAVILPYTEKPKRKAR